MNVMREEEAEEAEGEGEGEVVVVVGEGISMGPSVNGAPVDSGSRPKGTSLACIVGGGAVVAARF